MSREELQRVADQLGIQLNSLCVLRQVFNSVFELRSIAHGGYIAVSSMDELLCKIHGFNYELACLRCGDDVIEHAVRELDPTVSYPSMYDRWNGSRVIAFSGFARWFCNAENTIGLAALPSRSKKSRWKARKKAPRALEDARS